MNKDKKTMPMHTPSNHHPPSPLRGTKFQKIGFIAPILKFPSAEISKTINMLSNYKHGTTNVTIR